MSLSEQAVGIGLNLIPKPEKIYIEKSKAGQILHCDFLVENLTDEKWRLKHIELSVFDTAGKLITRRFVDESGSIQTIPNRELDAKTSALIFNPFFLFDHHIELQPLRYSFTFPLVTVEIDHSVKKR